MQAVVLAAGEGQRLRPFTSNKPKVMIKVANKPVLEYVIEALRDAGILDLVIVVGYKKSRIIDYFGGGSKFGVRIEYAFQQQQLGTAHALKQAEKLISDRFLVIAGDNIVDSDTIKKINRPWTLACKEAEEPSKYGVVLVANGVVKEIVEKPEKPISNLVNTGIYCFTTEIFDVIENQVDLVSVINSMIADGYEFRCVEANTWVDIVYPWDIIKVNDFAMKFPGKTIAGKVERADIVGDVTIGENTVIRGNAYIKGPVILGENCEIGPNTVIMPSTSIGDNVKVGPLSYIENSVIGDNVVISPNSCIKNSVIDRGCIINSNFITLSDLAEIKIGDEYHRVKTGAFVGEGCCIGAGVVLEAGTIVGNDVRILSLKKVGGSIPDKSVVV